MVAKGLRRLANRGSCGRMAAAALLLLGLAACEDAEYTYPEREYGQADPYMQRESVFGPEGITFGGEDQQQGSGEPGIGVNSFLWRASLDTVSFMPLVSADPFGGVIITDWYSPAQSRSERFKVNVYILGRALRADGIRASVFRQQRDGTTGWADAQVAPNTATDLENAILTRARQMRIAQLGE